MDIIEFNGQEFYCGMNMPSPHLTAACELTSIEDTAQMLTMDKIIEVAKSGVADKRKLFDKTYITDQKNHGSCCGHGCAAALTKSRVRRGLEKVILSGAYIYSKINYHRDNGALLEDGRRALMKFGSTSLESVPWNKIYPEQQPSNADEEASRYRGFEALKAGTMQGLWSGLALGFDAVVAVHAGNRFMNLSQSGVAGVDHGPGNHCVSADGLIYDKELIALGVNSWGLSYGYEGRMNLTENHFKEPFENHVFFLIRSTEDDPKSPNPPGV